MMITYELSIIIVATLILGVFYGMSFLLVLTQEMNTKRNDMKVARDLKFLLGLK